MAANVYVLILWFTVCACLVTSGVEGIKRSINLLPLGMRLQDTIPGEPIRDYPVFDDVPRTSFQCTSQALAGYYADVEARCQVFHICQFSGRQDSFLCPNGSLFDQRYFVCNWWFNVDCNDAPNFYSLNSHLFTTSDSPFFVEDVSTSGDVFTSASSLPVPGVVGGGSVVPATTNEFDVSSEIPDDQVGGRSQDILLSFDWQTPTQDSVDAESSWRRPTTSGITWNLADNRKPVFSNGASSTQSILTDESYVDEQEIASEHAPVVSGYPVEEEFPEPQVEDPYISSEAPAPSLLPPVRYPATTYRPYFSIASPVTSPPTFASPPPQTSQIPQRQNQPTSGSTLSYPTLAEVDEFFDGPSESPLPYVTNSPRPDPVIQSQTNRPVPLTNNDQTYIANQGQNYANYDEIAEEDDKKFIEYDDSYATTSEVSNEPSPLSNQLNYGQRLVPIVTVSTSSPIEVSSVRGNVDQGTAGNFYPADDYEDLPIRDVEPVRTSRPPISFVTPSTPRPINQNQQFDYPPENSEPVSAPTFTGTFTPETVTNQPLDYSQFPVPSTTPVPEQLDIDYRAPETVQFISQPIPMLDSPVKTQKIRFQTTPIPITEFSDVSVDSIRLSPTQEIQRQTIAMVSATKQPPPSYPVEEEEFDVESRAPVENTYQSLSPPPPPSFQPQTVTQANLFEYPNAFSSSSTPQPPISQPPISHVSQNVFQSEEESYRTTNSKPNLISTQNNQFSGQGRANVHVFSAPSTAKPQEFFPTSVKPSSTRGSAFSYPTDYAPINEFSSVPPSVPTENNGVSFQKNNNDVNNNPSSSYPVEPLVTNTPIYSPTDVSQNDFNRGFSTFTPPTPAYSLSNALEDTETGYRTISPTVKQPKEEFSDPNLLEILTVDNNNNANLNQNQNINQNQNVNQYQNQGRVVPFNPSTPTSVSVRPTYPATSDPIDTQLEEMSVIPIPQNIFVDSSQHQNTNNVPPLTNLPQQTPGNIIDFRNLNPPPITVNSPTFQVGNQYPNPVLQNQNNYRNFNAHAINPIPSNGGFLNHPNATPLSLPIINLPFARRSKNIANGETFSPQALPNISLKRIRGRNSKGIRHYRVNAGNNPVVIRLSKDPRHPPKIEIKNRRMDDGRVNKKIANFPFVYYSRANH